ncbi:PstS ABC-type phosphate transport system protein [Leptospira biflexa serovar Patoc strain 'Patoc 1 (Ames)']|uniref:Putative ABC-type transport system, periplasmic phosphate-binding protein n=1 Tax=Leptospira biflexa serovar Patoc (strain Patoc 1 / ATCC 23582 / Paris) TaxID=456481 RepID=B0SQ73_LEPBP|nr:phosphate ABC transporter substrate-binding protein [Leptospira biflexa]ABZ95519.1 PstS ABC-type phosphate transport system protein [Leptospira biflexa serovar Patoc strain 'Patoc 1 (Ames)']ABZ99225.1 Putative ABC-type transport system, periplasmic phosphate-binding protein [Leptospira biflexa serovar Patoc strain 'Patoc 1 (Paris)']TGM35828.1 phosphate ABC transporter substrate-binding protein [Leptospira biflexa]TGM37198.1 phosphate ABC transporter substrate-binding protein [Leptospira bifl
MKNLSLLFYILITINFVACKDKQTLKVAGSETMNSMMLFLGTEYEKTNSNVRVTVEGGGSEAGIDRLRKGEIDMAVSSRDLNQAEFDDLRKTGNLEKVRLAYDGVALVVNPKNPVAKLNLVQTSDIFSGKIKNWKEVGGSDAPIAIVIRNDKSGTQDYFQNHILKRKDLGPDEYTKFKSNVFSPNAKIVKDNAEMAKFIQDNPNSIGYMGMGSALVDHKDKIKALDYARNPKDPYVAPSVRNVYDRKYRLARELFMIYKTDQGDKIDAFVTFLTSEQGQVAVLQSGYLRASLPEVEVSAEPVK